MTENAMRLCFAHNFHLSRIAHPLDAIVSRNDSQNVLNELRLRAVNAFNRIIILELHYYSICC